MRIRPEIPTQYARFFSLSLSLPQQRNEINQNRNNEKNEKKTSLFVKENALIGRQKLKGYRSKFITVVIDKGPKEIVAELSSRR